MPGAPIVDARRHRRAAAAVVAGVLLVHAWLLGGVPITWPGAGGTPPRAGALQTRQLEAPLPVAPAPRMEPAPAPRMEPAPAPRVEPAPPLALALAPALRAAAPERAPRPGRPAARAPAVAVAATPEVAPPAAVVPEAAGDLPLYRTEPAPPVALRYDMTLGRLAGTGTLNWQPEGDRYSVAFEGRVAGLPLLTQASTGALTRHGLEPARFTDRRARRGELAVNFNAQAGKVSFSGPSTVLDRHPGMQDRLSWMLQLAAIVAAEPQRLAEGGQVLLHVIGPRGDAGVWALRSTGPQTLHTPAGALDAVRFVREARGPYDTTAELWLARERPHWPLRLVLGNGTDAGAFELLIAPMGR